MVNPKDNKHLSKKELADCYYGIPSSPDARAHLDSCTDCQNAYSDLRGHMEWIAADYERQATSALDPYFFAREAQAIMSRVRASRSSLSFLFARWRWFAASAAFLVVLVGALTVHTSQRQYKRLWDQAHTVVAEFGPVSPNPNEFISVFDDGNSNPGFPIGPDVQDSELFGSD